MSRSGKSERMRQQLSDRVAAGETVAYCTTHGAAMIDSVSTTCARCATPLEATDATVDDVVKAHEERCVIVGDLVRITMPRTAWHGEHWVDGELLYMETRAVGGYDGTILVHAASKERSKYVGTERFLSWGTVNTIRRIPRPEQALKPKWLQFKVDWAAMDESSTPKEWNREYLGEWTRPDDRVDALVYGRRAIAEQHAKRVEHLATPIAHRDVKPENVPTDPLDVEYDGVTLGELLSVDEAARREDRVAQLATWTWSPSQRAAVSTHWSAELRAKVAASSERERLTVVVEQDAEDEPWR